MDVILHGLYHYTMMETALTRTLGSPVSILPRMVGMDRKSEFVVGMEGLGYLMNWWTMRVLGRSLRQNSRRFVNGR